MALSDDEKKRWEEQFRKEVLEEHHRRSELMRAREDEDVELAKQAELLHMRMQVREQFWKDQGYVRYTDSRGQESWVTPEEYELRMERRRARGRPWQEMFYSEEVRNVLIGVVVLGVAVALGILLSMTA